MKFLLLIVIVFAVWRALQWIEQSQGTRIFPRQAPPGSTGSNARARQMRATDTVVCSRCGTYVPADRPVACGQADCPFPQRPQG